MPEVELGPRGVRSTAFATSENLIMARTRSTRSVRIGAVLSARAATLGAAPLVATFLDAGGAVCSVSGRGPRSLGERERPLCALPDARFSGGVPIEERSGDPVVHTENVRNLDTTRALGEPADSR